ncbi:MarR family winged helix-turn-helix transcriptional regulator [Devosia limi]|uniref:DNA-binding transcriptional regulator, MarR family n=1 Tax=Devosia limi DSM 17137 TaxID=1121477 RepID=A0A1M4SMX0_9HYPH|nr:MarR family transcriptional regulator [Devosia limi]SHE33317.1 DNA-binding transcriptional regulator, MarR family [Devosia limi DSM 17137]
MTQELELESVLRDLTGEMTHVYRWLAESAGINHTDLMCLFFVRSADGTATPKAVSQHLGLTSGATAIMLNRLEAAGFIVRGPHPTDRRGVLLSLGTEVRESGLLQLREKFIDLNQAVYAAFSEEELAVVRRFMRALLVNTRDSLRRMRMEHAAKSAETAKVG